MRITLECSGGFAVFSGLQRDIVVDTTELAVSDALQLSELVQRAVPDGDRALHQAGSGAADMRTYRLTVCGENCHSRVMSFSDPIVDEALAELVDTLRHFDR